MAYIDPDVTHVPTTGQAAAAAWGLVVGDSLVALADPPACAVFASGTQPVPDAIATILDADSERYDTDAMHTAASASRLVAVTGGRYLAWTTVAFDASVGGGPIGSEVGRVAFLLNGDIRGRDTRPLAAAGLAVRASMTTRVRLAAGQFLEVQVFQNSGGSAPVQLVEFGMLWRGR